MGTLSYEELERALAEERRASSFKDRKYELLLEHLRDSDQQYRDQVDREFHLRQQLREMEVLIKTGDVEKVLKIVAEKLLTDMKWRDDGRDRYPEQVQINPINKQGKGTQVDAFGSTRKYPQRST